MVNKDDGERQRRTKDCKRAWLLWLSCQFMFECLCLDCQVTNAPWCSKSLYVVERIAYDVCDWCRTLTVCKGHCITVQNKLLRTGIGVYVLTNRTCESSFSTNPSSDAFQGLAVSIFCKVYRYRGVKDSNLWWCVFTSFVGYRLLNGITKRFQINEPQMHKQLIWSLNVSKGIWSSQMQWLM